jgi:general secretion pathway protein D
LNGASIGFGKTETNSNGDRSFYGALIQAIKTMSNANLLSTPSIMTIDNQEAKIVVGQNVPFITGQSTNSSSGTSNPFTTIERQDVGITLKVKPHIGEGGTVKLEVEQEVSSVVPSVAGVNSADLITNKRSIKTTILADDGQTIVLGGLIQDDNSQSVNEVPLLSKIPLLGHLFRAKSHSQTKRNLLVFLQPIILRNSQNAVDLAAKQYNQIRILQLEVGEKGKLSRLPEQIDQIYQGATKAAPPKTVK